MTHEMTRAEHNAQRDRVLAAGLLAPVRCDRQFEAGRKQRPADDIAARARRRDLTALPGPSAMPDETGFYEAA